jgi:hypothetical protein
MHSKKRACAGNAPHGRRRRAVFFGVQLKFFARARKKRNSYARGATFGGTQALPCHDPILWQ